jgi:hypothetical protein
MNPLIRWTNMAGGSSDCRWLGTRLGYYLEGALGPRAMSRANGHLDECPSCQQSATRLEESLAAARGLHTQAPGFDFEEAVWEKIRISREIERRPETGWHHPRWNPFRMPRLALLGGGVVGLSAAAVVVMVVMSQTGDVTDVALPGDGVQESLAPVSPTSESATPWSDVEGTSERMVTVSGGASETATANDRAPELAAVSPQPASLPQAGDETAPPAGFAPGTTFPTGTARLEPGLSGDELYLDGVQMVPDPMSPDRGYYPVREAVVTRPGTARIAF